MLRTIRSSFFFAKLLFNYHNQDWNSLYLWMSKQKGLPQKVGQLLSLNDERGQFLQIEGSRSNLQKDLVKKKAAGDIAIETEPISCASIGQVYRGIYRGRKIVVKVKYNDIERNLRKDIISFQLVTRFLLGFLPGKDPRIKVALKEYLTEILEMLLKELNYELELQNQLSFYNLFNNIGGNIVIPEPIIELSSRNMIASEYLGGEHLRDLKGDKSLFKKKLFEFYLNSLSYGLIHTDPHPGNFKLIKENQGFKLVILDFGSVKHIDTKKGMIIKEIFIKKVTEKILMDYLNELGFSEKVLEEYKDILYILYDIISEPFLNGSYKTPDNLNYKLNTLLSSRNFKAPFYFPKELLFIFRTFSGLLQI